MSQWIPRPLIRWFFEETGADKICRIATDFNDFGCHWTTVLGFFDGTNVKYIEETIEGNLPESPRGTGGYSWDNIFIPKGGTKTFAEMTFEEKQRYAVTSKILTKFNQYLSHDNK